MVRLSRSVSLPLVVSKAGIADLKRKGSALTLNVNLTFCELSDGHVVGASMFLVLFHPLKARITFLFVVFSLLCDLEYVVSANVLILSSNWASIILCMSYTVLAVVLSVSFLIVVFSSRSSDKRCCRCQVFSIWFQFSLSLSPPLLLCNLLTW